MAGCGEWNASLPLCFPGGAINTTANASLGEADPGLAPRYWALFLLLFPIFTVSLFFSQQTV